MEKQEVCPICGEANKRTYFTESVGLCEDYYYCSTCGYFYHMCYSPRIEGFSLPPGKTELEIIKEFGEKFLEKNLKYVPSECMP